MPRKHALMPRKQAFAFAARTLAVCVSASMVVLAPLAAQSGRMAAPSRGGMVVSSHYLGSEAGQEILDKGGNAVDAAVATAFALAVTLPSAGNVGGGGFLVYHGADGEVTTFNFREKAALAATERMYLGPDGEVRDNSNHIGLLAVGVPGTVAGMWKAHQRLGRLPWADLLEPAIRLAEDGMPSTWAMQNWLRSLPGRAGPLYDATRAAFLKDGVRMYEPGETFRQPDLAETLRRIQADGHDGFYRGETAKLLADFMAEHGGLITEEDLARYEADELTPIHGTYRGYDVYSMPPPSSGGTGLVEMLNILEGYDLAEIGHNSALYLHLLTESMRRSYADRALHLGDPKFNPDMPIERLTSKEYAGSLRASIDMEKASKSDSAAFNGAFLQASEETTHYSVVDSEGNAVSVTYTLEFGYGSSVVVPGAGFLLNNELGDFNAVPGRTNSLGTIGTPPNLVAPEKQPLSSMTPTIVARDGRPVLAIGSPGGRTIINTTLQVVLNVIDHGMTGSQFGRAIESPRIHHQWLPDVTSFEEWGFSPDTKRLYEGMGHVTRTRGGQGQAMGIYIDWDTGLRWGASDSRAFDGGARGN
ncbi:MAG: gamma-glutamyltransferase [Gemmatimonadota bacterium]|uniref:gamma-glutamyltransferase n=1 Tax=Candidatus Palauibacter scopulicola TaxID=3056741 RepID=UPI002396F5AE|nr:gamma-glutamyltransferase [Candidatus Palauibacter scopulicola]MDE2662235.1 gamma-glutamyltransferase [Candidatus Palauibacter scopulicola]